MRMPKSIFYTFAFSLMLVFSACAMLPKNDTGELLTQYATLKFINSSDDPIARAFAIGEIAREGKRLFDNETLPVAEIETLIRNRIKWSDLSVEDILLANALIERVVGEVGSHELPVNQRVSGSTVLGWIITAADMVAR